MALIRACKLPAHVIRKLKLQFPGSQSRKRYGAVEFKYQTEGGTSNEREAGEGDQEGGRFVGVAEGVARTSKLEEGSNASGHGNSCGSKERREVMEETNDAGDSDTESEIPPVCGIVQSSKGFSA